MKIGILGVGAVGGVISGYLARAKHDIILIDIWPEHVDCINEKGLKITAFEEEFIVTPRACLLYTSPSPRDRTRSRMPSSA